MNYFDQVVLEIWENNQLKSSFRNPEIEILSPNYSFTNFKMHIPREPVILEQQMSLFGKKSFIN